VNVFDADDHHHMVRALELARRGLYSTPPNPAVGCVLVRWGQVVGEGFHQRAGEPHAEIVALHEAGIAARGSTAYVTLEPCSHHGRTPPCADALIAAGVRRVVVAMRDPNPRVDGSGLERIEAASILTAHGLLAHEAAEINRGFVRRMVTGRPWVTLKLGASLDGRTALADGTSKWITGERARADVQRLRARASAIITGSGTVVADDPMLTVRDPDLEMRGRRPLRVVLDSSLATPPTAQVLSFSGSTLILTRDAGSPLAEPLRESGARVESVRPSTTGLDLDAVLERLGELECNEVLVEAGPTLAGDFIRLGLVDEIVVYMAPVVLGDAARGLFNLPPLSRMCDRCEFEWRDVARIGDDLRLTLRPRRGGP
jgi:diaminohydroxyphosphoribosylaminopyrimidine deaminase / 5-amino-6-(5-phosphoribosylamino)uracil reductase